MRNQQRDQQRGEKLDETELKYGVEWAHSNGPLSGWIANIKTHLILDSDEREIQVLLIFLLTQDGQWYKCYYEFNPYFFVECEKEYINETIVFLDTRFEKQISRIEVVNKMDLEQINHLSGSLKPYLKLSFRTVADLVVVRNQLRNRIEKNQMQEKETFGGKSSASRDPMRYLMGIREYDVPYHCRVCIDTGIRCGKWFIFNLQDRAIMSVEEDKVLVAPPQINYLSYDIETSKLPLMFPDAKIDQIMMISLQYESHAILITNRQTVGQDVEGFSYAPKPDFAVEVEIYNEANEYDLIKRFFWIIHDYKPLVISSFNGDRFDWPFIEERCINLGLSMEDELGVRKQEESGEYYGRFVCHMDCYCWVDRDAFLPQGSHGLKAVTRAKLGYEPVEVDPEEMVTMAQRNSQKLAEYSISDAVATYYLYKKHIHDFIFALCTIIPLSPDEVLRKGSGTLCECLLMAMAYKQNIIFPNKKKEQLEKFYQGHLLDSETYIGGKVECLRSGVYREEFAQNFKMEQVCLQELYDGVPRLIEFMAKIEAKQFAPSEIQRCADEIQRKLQGLLDRGEHVRERPLIYHLDVAAMYPNIILTNRLQPVAIVDNKICSGCVFNSVESNCKRPLEWQWKGEYFPLQRNEYESIKMNLELEFQNKPPQFNGQRQIKSFKELVTEEQQKLIKARVKMYSQKTYKTIHNHTVQLRKDTVCMRENDFYVSTVRDFRDRRYEFKELVKVWKARQDEGVRTGNVGLQREAKDRMALYDSLQLAHKIILNSFYGYVMRKGARWYSMEMAAMVTHIGTAIITTARQWVERIGLPLELDTDGIWCMFPMGFPEDFTMMDLQGKRVKFSYPCFVLNELVNVQYQNDQYQFLKDADNLEYGTRTEMSIFFEVDGPYKCMMIPAAREENKTLKKRYVVYHMNGSIAELKGFEIKRRGELRIIKIFQEEIFKAFVKGSTLSECFEECGKVCYKWLDLLWRQGQGLDDQELIYYIGQSRMLSKDLRQYGLTQKACAITVGKRMAEFLGEDTVKGPGLNCSFVVSRKPVGAPVTERAIPTTIFQTETDIRARFLRKWLKDPGIQDSELEMRNLIDWEYYLERLGNTIQKIVIIPALMQGEQNPVPQIMPPDWLRKRMREMSSGLQQKKMGDYFAAKSVASQKFAQIKHQVDTFRPIMEIEDIGRVPLVTPIKNINRSIPVTPIKVDQTITNQWDMDKQFLQWLPQQKKVWESQMNKKKKIGQQVVKAVSLRDHFDIQQKAMLQQVWQILQVYEVELGKFIVWALLEEGGQLINTVVNVPRRIYVNSLNKEITHNQVKRVLPREKANYFLYEVTLSEEKFQNQHGSFTDFLANPVYEGIYELKEPLQFRMITELGCMWKMMAQKKYLEAEDFRPVYELSSHKKYLENEQQNLLSSHLFIEHIQFDSTRAIWSVFCPRSLEYTFILVSPVKNKQDYRVVARAALKKSGVEEPKLRIQFVENNAQACLFIENSFNQLKQQLRICIIRSQSSLASLKQIGLRFPCTEFPTLLLPKLDSEPGNPVGWIERAIKLSVERYSTIPKLVGDLLHLSRYASVPLCNVIGSQHPNEKNSNTTGHYLNHVTDILYSRVLKQLFNGVSWYGNQSSDTRDLVPTDFQPSEYEFPGIYMSYCVEIKILLLSINTIALSDELKNTDREISALMAGESLVDELACAKTAFRVLKTLVLGWLEDVMTKGDPLSDELLQNICRWVYGGVSPLYDEYLGKMLTRLNKKVFQQFTLKLKQLGARVIFASMNKVIIATGKQTYASAEAYTRYILEDLIQQPLFKYLCLRPTKYYSSLLYKDQYNYLGFTCELDQDEVDQPLEVQLILNEFLPQRLQGVFTGLLTAFLERGQTYRRDVILKAKDQKTAQAVMAIQSLEKNTIIHLSEYIRDELSQTLYKAMNVLNDGYQNAKQTDQETQMIQQEELKISASIPPIHSDSQSSQPEEDEEEEQDSFIVDDNQVEYDLNNNDILADVQDHEIDHQMQQTQNNNTFEQNWEMPDRIGLRQKTAVSGIASLLIYLTHMLSLDDFTEQEVRRVKANSCRILHMSEFSSESEFQDPCLVLKVPNLVCNFCYHVSDHIDLFREQEFKCENCNIAYDTPYVEDRICDYIERYLAFYYVQDLYCMKCKQVQEDPIIKRCPCSGQFQLKLNQFPNELMTNFKMFKESLIQLAIQRDMPFLEELMKNIK